MDTNSVSNNSNSQKEIITQYLVAEFEVLQQRATQQEQAIANKINLYTASVSVVAGGMFVALDKLLSYGMFLPIAGTVFVLFFLTGMATLWQILDLHASTIIFYRRAGRIRQWFLNLDSSVKAHIPFTVTDDAPAFYTRKAPLRGVESVILLINSAITAFLAGMIYWLIATNFYPHFERTKLVTITIGLLIFCLSWFLQVLIVRRFLDSRQKDEERRGMIHFPLSKS